ncbi:MAG: hypothetical protein H6922_06560 [Pseudomonadaceae bacterium]|nr:hypothetical protein [Pseudomonadaceae bacterium]
MSQPLDKIAADQYVKVDALKRMAESGVSLPPELLRSVEQVQASEHTASGLKATAEELPSVYAMASNISSLKDKGRDKTRILDDLLKTPEMAPAPQRDTEMER